MSRRTTPPRTARTTKARTTKARTTKARMRKADVEVERVYDDPVVGRHRVLVDRLWPRGVTKERAALDEWRRDLAPTTELRRWYGHDPERFEEFDRRYREELSADEAKAALEAVRDHARRGEVALVTATRDLEHSGARVLLEVLREG